MQASSLGWYLHGQPAPLLDLELDETTKVKNTDNKLVGKLTSSGRSFTSFQMVHTHTRLAAARLVFGNCEVVSEALIWALEQDTAIDAKSKYREEICG